MNSICRKYCFRVFSSDGCSKDMAFLLQLSSHLTKSSQRKRAVAELWTQSMKIYVCNSTRHQNSKQKL
ncbi:hypothetical protein CARUB_v10003107mg [Capsella rubella]|uniref:Uncharacterized protein n=1 Tax=Capsella rubella TaxID=81985 RepID=R0GZU8_9BRAS|nr:hypothetical protein CARUB_v10003107mg [Capsella rubella]